MGKDKILHDYKTTVNSGRYTLLVNTVEKYWAGHDSGKMEDMPGIFLDSNISLQAISGELSPVEQLAVQNKVVLWPKGKLEKLRCKEITNEPKGYGKLYHEDLVERAKKNPQDYIGNIPSAVKEAL